MVDKKSIEHAVIEILTAVGENPNREGLKETPARVANMCEELMKGLHQKPEDEVKIFQEDSIEESENWVIVKNIPIYSLCEHHLMPFFGSATVIYVPDQHKVIGLSKIARVIDIISKKPQLQERLTDEITQVLQKQINPKGVFVFIEAEHLCVTMRGIKAIGTKTETTSCRGMFESDASMRAEAYQIVHTK